jgi:F-type H+-transporting ATPase subunit b
MTHLIFFGSIGSDLVKTGADTAQKFGVDWPHFIAQCISFLIVAGLLRTFAYKPILTALADRRQRIADSLADADKIKAELARTEAMKQEVLDKANVQANKLIEEARAAAARVQEQETQKAIAQAEQIMAKAREAATLEHQRMLTDLRREVITLVVHTTGMVAGKVLTAEDQQRLADEARRQLAA